MSKKMITPPKEAKDWWNEKVKPIGKMRGADAIDDMRKAWGKRHHLNKNLRSWKPFRDKGLGLGKLAYGLLQTGADALPGASTHPGFSEKLQYAGRSQSLSGATRKVIEGEGWQDKFAHQNWLKGGALKAFKEQYGDSPIDLSNTEIMQIIDSGDRELIKAFFHVMGKDMEGNDSFLDAFMERGLNLRRRLNKKTDLNKTQVDTQWAGFGSELEKLKRGNLGFGSSDTDMLSDFSSDMYNLNQEKGQQSKDEVIEAFLRSEGLI